MKNDDPRAGQAAPPAPKASAWDNVLDAAQASERRGFLFMLGGLGLAGLGGAQQIIRLVQPGPLPIIADVCRTDTIAVRTADMPPGRPALHDIAEDLMAWLRGAREVSFDGDFITRQATWTYNHTRSGSQAEAQLLAHHRANDPHKAAKQRNVKLERQTAIPAAGVPSSNTWKLEWREVARARDGVLVSRLDWRADVSFVLNPSTTHEAIRKNARGLYVDSFFWTQVGAAPPNVQANRGESG